VTDGPRRRAFRVLLVALLVVVLFGTVAGAVVVRDVAGGGQGATVSVTIPPGSSGARITSILAHAHVIRSRLVFRAYTRLAGMGVVQAGKYRMHRNLSARAALRILHAGPVVKYASLTIPEGLTLDQIADRVGALPGRTAAAFLALANGGHVRSAIEPAGVNSLEGLLYPDTYLVTPTEDEQAILTRLVGHFDDVGTELHLADKAAALGLTPYQAVIVASLVETEAKVDADRGPIASVILNRLARHMKLQIDATVLYALGHHKTVVLNRDLEIDSPYNTYKVDGLPPTPIAAAGEASLTATLSPPQTDYLYYVLIDKNGKHGFASTEAEFNALLAQAHRNGVR